LVYSKKEKGRNVYEKFKSFSKRKGEKEKLGLFTGKKKSP
jgi:hypothetical protein